MTLKLSKAKNSKSHKIIILLIMPFGTKKGIDFDNRFNTLKNEIEFIDKAYSIHRVDLDGNADINQKMYKMIHSADCVVADLTLLNPNVMYELGSRHTLRKKITIMCKSVDKIRIPFDTQSFAVIHFEDQNIRELAKQIVERIKHASKTEAMDDSPILKEIEPHESKIPEYKAIFETYHSAKTDFFLQASKYKESNNYKKLLKHTMNYEKQFGNLLEFRQLKILATYKAQNETETGLREALKLINKENTLSSLDHEILGLNVSILRKISLLQNARKKEIDTATHAVNRFYEIYKTPYSISQKLLHETFITSKELSGIEKNEVKDYIVGKYKILTSSLKEAVASLDLMMLPHGEEQWLKETLALVNFADDKINGQKVKPSGNDQLLINSQIDTFLKREEV